ncbi:hypothetical protein Nm8I071_22890 [Nonomuraea sp. TT08I-71]|nr:hypothetical protein Nm8I071_22890 [Nonomuraea sp. TT08I-71]
MYVVAQDGPFATAAAVSAIMHPDRWAQTARRFQRAHAMRLRGGAGPVRVAAVQPPVLLIMDLRRGGLVEDDGNPPRS